MSEAVALPNIFPRLAAPLTVPGKAVLSEFQLTLKEILTGRLEIMVRGEFYRASDGRWRTNYFGPPSVGGKLTISTLWDPRSTTSTSVSFADRNLHRHTRGGFAFASQRQWRAAGPFAFAFLPEEKILLGLPCQRVILMPAPKAGDQMRDYRAKFGFHKTGEL